MLKGVGRHKITASQTGVQSFQVRAAIDGGISRSQNSYGFGTTGSATLGDYEKDLLDGFITNNEKINRRMYRDMYYNDPIAGSAIDLQAELPFSDFTLSALPDQDMLKVYASNIESLNIKSLLPEITREHQVDGAFVGYLNKDDTSGVYSSIMPQNLDSLNVTPLPIYGRDPIIDLIIPQNIRELYNKGDSRVKEAFEKYGDDLPSMMNKDVIPLDPKDVLYIPRRTFSTNPIGTSVLRRLLPIWLMEKALLRGSIDLSYRRQKAILHIVAGDETWEANDQELTTLVNMVIQADADPTGAIIATRPGINFEEIRNASDFWRYDEMYDFFSNIKMRGLGISESFLSGDSSYSSMESSLSVFIDQIRAYREMLTRKIFYTKLFPLIASTNDFTVERYAKQEKHKTEGAFIKDRDGYYIWSSDHAIIARQDEEEIDLTKYLLPKLQWHKQLKPEADSDYLGLLSTAEEKGVPIPLRVWAAAVGLSLPELLSSLDEDINLRKRIDKYNKEKPKPPLQEANDLFTGASTSMPRKKNRDFHALDLKLRDPDTRKILSKKGERVLSERIHKKVAEAMSNIAKRENAKTKKEQSSARTRAYSYANRNNIKPESVGIYGATAI